MSYNIGDIFTDDEEYSARAEWCNDNGYYIEEIDTLEDGTRQFKICEIEHNEELELAEQELSNTENRISEIKAELLTAVLLDDTDTIEALKSEYRELMTNE